MTYYVVEMRAAGVPRDDVVMYVAEQVPGAAP
eukprot:SAG25_NODE_14191_length_258_cov_0.597484_2_plen_31_part_01